MKQPLTKESTVSDCYLRLVHVERGTNRFRAKFDNSFLIEGKDLKPVFLELRKPIGFEDSDHHRDADDCQSGDISEFYSAHRDHRRDYDDVDEHGSHVGLPPDQQQRQSSEAESKQQPLRPHFISGKYRGENNNEYHLAQFRGLETEPSSGVPGTSSPHALPEN